MAGTVAVVYLTAGQGAIWSYVLATVVVVLVGLSIAQFARRTAAAGSLYTYTASGLGRGTAFAGGWGLIMTATLTPSRTPTSTGCGARIRRTGIRNGPGPASGR